MSNSIKTIFTALGTTGIVATGGLVYTHNKTHHATIASRKENLELAKQRLELDREIFELEKFKNNVSSVFSQDLPPLPKPSTPVSDFLDNKINLDKLNDSLNSSIINVQENLPTEPVQLAGLAIICFTLGTCCCLIVLILNNYQQTKGLPMIIKKIPSFEKTLKYYSIIVAGSSIYSFIWLIFFLTALLLIGLYLLFIFNY